MPQVNVLLDKIANISYGKPGQALDPDVLKRIKKLVDDIVDAPLPPDAQGGLRESYQQISRIMVETFRFNSADEIFWREISMKLFKKMSSENKPH